VDADEFKDGLIHSLGFTCPDVGDSENQLRCWTRAVDADGDCIARMYASIVSVEVVQWVDDHFGTNDTATVGGLWMQMTHDDKSDGVLISTGPARP
jgi:hypothetical protein